MWSAAELTFECICIVMCRLYKQNLGVRSCIMRPLHSKRLHSNICFFIGETNFCRINRLIQGSLTKHTGKQILPAGKADIGQSSRNKNSQANLSAHQILIFKSCPNLNLLWRRLLCNGLIIIFLLNFSYRTANSCIMQV